MSTARKPRQLLPGDKTNFATIVSAASAGDLALVSAIRKSDGASVALVCAMADLGDGQIMPIPLAVMVEGNPFELFEDPTIP